MSMDTKRNDNHNQREANHSGRLERTPATVKTVDVTKKSEDHKRVLTLVGQDIEVVSDSLGCTVRIPIASNVPFSASGEFLAYANYLRAFRCYAFDLDLAEKQSPDDPGALVMATTFPHEAFDAGMTLRDAVRTSLQTVSDLRSALRNILQGSDLATEIHTAEFGELEKFAAVVEGLDMDGIAKGDAEALDGLFEAGFVSDLEELADKPDLLDFYHAERPSFLDSKAFRITTEVVGTATLTLQTHARDFDTTIDYDKYSAQIIVRLASHLPDPARGAIASALLWSEADWKVAVSTEDDEAVAFHQLNALTAQELDERLASAVSFLEASYDDLCRTLEVPEVGRAASDVVPAPDETFVRSDRLRYAWALECLLAQVFYDPFDEDDDRHAYVGSHDVSIATDQALSHVTLRVNTGVAAWGSVGVAELKSLDKRLARAFRARGHGFRLAPSHDGAIREGDEVDVLYVCPLDSVVNHEGLRLEDMVNEVAKAADFVKPSLTSIANCGIFNIGDAAALVNETASCLMNMSRCIAQGSGA
jgi:hypothetical protein